jgi:formylglycine-generating enzyme required for sulfatase activity
MSLARKPEAERLPVTYVTFDQAVEYAERAGKRLPDEAEYEFVATDAGKQRFPWGDQDRIAPWPFGNAGEPDWDRTAIDPSVFGLCSNVAEWTSSCQTPYPGQHSEIVARFQSGQMPASFRVTRIVRGGSFGVVTGNPEPPATGKRLPWHPRYRHGISRDTAYPGLGFRCARSAAPRFLRP